MRRGREGFLRRAGGALVALAVVGCAGGGGWRGQRAGDDLRYRYPERDEDLRKSQEAARLLGAQLSAAALEREALQSQVLDLKAEARNRRQEIDQLAAQGAAAQERAHAAEKKGEDLKKVNERAASLFGFVAREIAALRIEWRDLEGGRRPRREPEDLDLAEKKTVLGGRIELLHFELLRHRALLGPAFKPAKDEIALVRPVPAGEPLAADGPTEPDATGTVAEPSALKADPPRTERVAIAAPAPATANAGKASATPAESAGEGFWDGLGGLIAREWKRLGASGTLKSLALLAGGAAGSLGLWGLWRAVRPAWKRLASRRRRAPGGASAGDGEEEEDDEHEEEEVGEEEEEGEGEEEKEAGGGEETAKVEVVEEGGKEKRQEEAEATGVKAMAKKEETPPAKEKEREKKEKDAPAEREPERALDPAPAARVDEDAETVFEPALPDLAAALAAAASTSPPGRQESRVEETDQPTDEIGEATIPPPPVSRASPPRAAKRPPAAIPREARERPAGAGARAPASDPTEWLAEPESVEALLGDDPNSTQVILGGAIRRPEDDSPFATQVIPEARIEQPAKKADPRPPLQMIAAPRPEEWASAQAHTQILSDDPEGPWSETQDLDASKNDTDLLQGLSPPLPPRGGEREEYRSTQVIPMSPRDGEFAATEALSTPPAGDLTRTQIISDVSIDDPPPTQVIRDAGELKRGARPHAVPARAAGAGQPPRPKPAKPPPGRKPLASDEELLAELEEIIGRKIEDREG